MSTQWIIRAECPRERYRGCDKGTAVHNLWMVSTRLNALVVRYLSHDPDVGVIVTPDQTQVTPPFQIIFSLDITLLVSTEASHGHGKIHWDSTTSSGSKQKPGKAF